MRRLHQRRGFSLVELMIATTLGGVVMAAMLSSFVFIGRNLSRLTSHQALENEARKGLAYLRRDFATARAIKSGTTPTASTVTLLFPTISGVTPEVTYTYDATTKKLRRHATTDVSPDLYLLGNDRCACTSFAFAYYTTTDSAPTSQVSATTVVPYSVKQIEVNFVLESPSTWTSERRTRFEAASSRFLIRNRTAPDGT